MALFPGMAVTAAWHGPGGDESRANSVVPGCIGDDGGGGQEGGGVVLTVEEEPDGVVLRHGGEGRADGAVPERCDSVEVVGVVAAWIQRH
jgi:hypothetical protein